MAVDRLFITILNMSLTGAFVIVVICLARLLLKKSPKSISYCLWAVAGFRLIFPFSIESMWSLIPFGAQPIAADTVMPIVTGSANAGLTNSWITIGAFIWLAGAIAMSCYGLVSYFVLKSKMRRSAHSYGNIYIGANIQSPFVLGFLSPKIYLPSGLSKQESRYVIMHEQIHIQRFDHIVKFVAFSVLCLHWFNPLVWLAFRLMSRDMEMSCDERVLSEMGIEETKEGYSMSLVSLAMERRLAAGLPLAFGECGVSARVRNVLSFKKYSKLGNIAAVALVAMLSVGLMTNQVGAIMPEYFHEEAVQPVVHTPQIRSSDWATMQADRNIIATAEAVRTTITTTPNSVVMQEDRRIENFAEVARSGNLQIMTNIEN